MAKAILHTFECKRYTSLSFYVCGKKKKFIDGVYKTTISANEVESIAGGLGHEWSFDNVSGVIVNDTAGGNGLTSDGVVFNEGLVGMQASIGANGYMDSNVNLIGEIASFDFEVTYKNDGVLFSQWAQDDSTNRNSTGWRVNITSTGIQIKSTNTASTAINTQTFTHGFTVGQSYHVHVARSSNNGWAVYVDGVSISSSGSTSINHNDVDFVIGGTVLNHSSYPQQTGQNDIDQFRVILGRVAEDYERAALRNGGMAC